uniref:Uncharacterized protein n=1 Tax=Siphoviridae sp. cttFh17 TaxID=2826491 RepID=A0A8S5NIH1_9CAUD|nr:MAG TPA: hypothetical protein [Siphoviridae sp. cttFh17]
MVLTNKKYGSVWCTLHTLFVSSHRPLKMWGRL